VQIASLEYADAITIKAVIALQSAKAVVLLYNVTNLPSTFYKGIMNKFTGGKISEWT
jgi:hypothetical protein